MNAKQRRKKARSQPSQPLYYTTSHASETPRLKGLRLNDDLYNFELGEPVRLRLVDNERRVPSPIPPLMLCFAPILAFILWLVL